MKKNRFVALLRGINVGGRKLVKMEELRKVFELLGFSNVTTLLNSGNVLFSTSTESQEKLARDIEIKLEKVFGHPIHVLIRSIDEIQSLIESQPFINEKITPNIRLYVTFLNEKPTSRIKIPYESAEGNFKILRATDTEVCSVLILSPETRTTEVMNILEKEYGKQVTTRNWNTVIKLVK